MDQGWAGAVNGAVWLTVLSPRGVRLTAAARPKSTVERVSAGPGPPPMLWVTSSYRSAVPSAR